LTGENRSFLNSRRKNDVETCPCLTGDGRADALQSGAGAARRRNAEGRHRLDPANTSLLGRAQILWRGADGHCAAIDGASAVPDDLPSPAGAPLEDVGLALAGLPGLPQALERLHAQHGRLPLAQVAEPAARLAENGFAPPQHLREVWALRVDALGEGGARPYCGADPAHSRAPEHFRHPKLAGLLRDFGRLGANSITRGETAKALVEGVRLRGGYWSLP